MVVKMFFLTYSVLIFYISINLYVTLLVSFFKWSFVAVMLIARIPIPRLTSSSLLWWEIEKRLFDNKEFLLY